MTNKYTFEINEKDVNLRIDKFLHAQLPEISRSYLQQLIKNGNVQTNSKSTKPSYKLESNDFIDITIPDPTDLNVIPQDIPLTILYEDADIIVINKSAEMVVHPGAGNHDATLVNALLFHTKSTLSGINGILRPGIVHRLDKNTTGCLVIAKNDNAHSNIAEQFESRTIEKQYLAITEGNFHESTGTISGFIKRDIKNRKRMYFNDTKGKKAITSFELIANLKDYSFIRLLPKTGRTHQLRVQLKTIGHPIIGDTLYQGHCQYKHFTAKRYILHAYKLKLKHPTTNQELLFTAPIPKDMLRIIEILGGNDVLSTL